MLELNPDALDPEDAELELNELDDDELEEL